ncbi:TPA: hypothetical protein ACOVJB_004342 [Klebsiella oxytoca]
MTNNQLTPERISDISDYFVEMQDHYSDPADRENFEIFRDAELLMKELQERRKADSEPVVCGSGCSKSKWHKMALDIDEYMNGEEARESKGRDEIYSEIILRLTRLDVLETILRNELGLPCESPIPDIAEKIYDMKRSSIYSVVPNEVTAEDYPALVKYDVAEVDEAWSRGFNACRAAMLQAEPVTTANKLGNSPVIPDGYVMVPKEPTESMINAWLSEVANWRGHVAGYKAMLAAAPQEVK